MRFLQPCAYTTPPRLAPKHTGQHKLYVLGFNVSSSTRDQVGVITFHVQLEHAAYFFGANSARAFKISYIAVQELSKRASSGSYFGLPSLPRLFRFPRSILLSQEFQISGHPTCGADFAGHT